MDNTVQQGRDRTARNLKAHEPGAITVAADLLREGHLVIFPTDTVYGIGARAFDADAVSRLYMVKQRPLHKAIPILLADLADIEKVAVSVPATASQLINRYWPGPLTLIVPKHANLPAVISPNDGVAVRIPNNHVARQLIRAAGGAVATSSANLSGRPPACSAEQALQELGSLVSAVLDGGPCGERVASTIVDCRSKRPFVVREGPIRAAQLFKASSAAP